MSATRSDNHNTRHGGPQSDAVGSGDLGGFDFSGEDVIDARALMNEIDWAEVSAPGPSTFAVETRDGRRLVTEAEFDEWLGQTRTAT